MVSLWSRRNWTSSSVNIGKRTARHSGWMLRGAYRELWFHAKTRRVAVNITPSLHTVVALSRWDTSLQIPYLPFCRRVSKRLKLFRLNPTECESWRRSRRSETRESLSCKSSVYCNLHVGEKNTRKKWENSAIVYKEFKKARPRANSSPASAVSTRQNVENLFRNQFVTVSGKFRRQLNAG